MSTLKFVSLLLMASFYIFAGFSHFRIPKFFLSITPKWVPVPEKVNFLIGAFEIIMGIALLFSVSRSYAAWGIIILLIAVFPANVYHLQKSIEKKKGILLTTIRLPLQFVLIYWAYNFI
jgi:uncharacterized membrane protein